MHHHICRCRRSPSRAVTAAASPACQVLKLFHSTKENMMCRIETGLKLGLHSLYAREEETVSSGTLQGGER